MKKIVIMIGALLMAACVYATPARPISAQESVAHGAASHVIELSYTNFVGTATNSTETCLTLCPIPAGSAVRFTEFVLDSAFTATSNGFNTLKLEAGDVGDTDRFITQTEVMSYTNYQWAAFTAPTGAVYYTAATNVGIKATPMLDYAFTNLTGGKARFYLKISP